MAILKCKMCGGDLPITEAQYVECEYCETKQTISNLSDEKYKNLFNRANQLRIANEFDKAAGIYESIISEVQTDAEAYWGLVLCKYGIEYVDDLKSGKKIPTCHRTRNISIMDDEDFIQACENADMVARKIYRDEAKKIDLLQKKILSIVETEESYDIFICYKEIDDYTKKRTEDSLIAQDIYMELVKEGYKVFFSRVSLKEKAGKEYEPYIYAALMSAKVMLVIGTQYEYLDAVWVKNEWKRFLSMMEEDSSKKLIPCIRNLDIYDIPKEFHLLQALDMNDVIFFKNLINSIKRTVKLEEKNSSFNKSDKKNLLDVDSLVKEAFILLEDGKWTEAKEYSDKILERDSENAHAYVILAMTRMCICTQEEFVNLEGDLEGNSYFQNAIKYADSSYKKVLLGYIKENYYRKAIKHMKESKYQSATQYFEKIKDYKDAQKLIEECKKNRKNEIEKANFQREKNAVGVRRTAMTKFRVNHFAYLKPDGTVRDMYICGYTRNEDRIGWKNIISIKGSDRHLVGLNVDGRVVAIGQNDDDQCNVNEWTDIDMIDVSNTHTVGLKKDGRVVATGRNDEGQCNVEEWTDICMIAVSAWHTVGLKSDGTVVAVGNNDNGRCDVNEWTDIVMIDASYYTIGIKADGTVVYTRDKKEGFKDYRLYKMKEWRDINKIVADCSAFGAEIIGINSKGEVVSTGLLDKKMWKNIVSIKMSRAEKIVGLKSDGTVVTTIYGIYNKIKDWTNIIDIYITWNEVFGIKSDGTVVIAEDRNNKILIDEIKTVRPMSFNTLKELHQYEKNLPIEYKEIQIEEEKQKQLEIERIHKMNREKMVCQYCGGLFKGVFTKTCVKCGKKKDY